MTTGKTPKNKERSAPTRTKQARHKFFSIFRGGMVGRIKRRLQGKPRRRIVQYEIPLPSPPPSTSPTPVRSHLGPHSDTLGNIGPQAIITGVSLGAKRVFVVHKKPPWGAKVKPPSASGGYTEEKKVTHVLTRWAFASTPHARWE